MGDETPNSSDILRILVATDNHLGYGEKDTVRGEDSFTAFEEMLELAVAEDVDFILLGGDLFHDAVPSQNTLHKCMQLLRRYTFGDKPIELEFLSDQELNFHNANHTVNYEDPNLNISIPVFSIHGNHDDPSGFGRLSSLDLLATTGLVNYFGRWTDLTKVVISPILLRKGQTHLALYGLSHIHDARLARLFENFKVTIECPKQSEDDWFHLMVVHQNRANRGPKNYLPEEQLPDFLNLVIWGHEHDCRIEPEHNVKQNFFVSQPGSSVPTSLAEGESLPKHVGLLQIHKTMFQMKPLPLQTVRPFVFDSVDLLDLDAELNLAEGDVANKIKSWAEKYVESMIEKSKKLLTGHPRQPTLPLIRLRIIFHSEEQMFNAIRFGQMFNKKVANSSDIVHFKKFVKKNAKTESADFDKDAMNKVFEEMEQNVSKRVEDLVECYFDETDKAALEIMNPKVLSELCFRLVERNDTNAADNIIQYCKKQAVEHLMETLPRKNSIKEELVNFKERITLDSVLKMLDDRGGLKMTTSKTKTKRKDQVDEDKNTETKSSTSSQKKSNNQYIDCESDSDDTVLSTKITRSTASNNKNASIETRGRGRRRAAARGGSVKGTNARNKNSSSAHKMPSLNISINKTRESPPQTLLNVIGQTRSAKQKKVNTYVISDSD